MLHESRCDVEAQQHYPSVESRRLLATRLTPLAVGRVRALIDADADLRARAERRLKPRQASAAQAMRVRPTKRAISSARDVVKHVSDRWIANYAPSSAEALALLDAVVYLYGAPAATRGGVNERSQAPAELDRRALCDMQQFLREV